MINESPHPPPTPTPYSFTSVNLPISHTNTACLTTLDPLSSAPADKASQAGVQTRDLSIRGRHGRGGSVLSGEIRFSLAWPGPPGLGEAEWDTAAGRRGSPKHQTNESWTDTTAAGWRGRHATVYSAQVRLALGKKKKKKKMRLRRISIDCFVGWSVRPLVGWSVRNKRTFK